jgi:hypothetical protein
MGIAHDGGVSWFLQDRYDNCGAPNCCQIRKKGQLLNLVVYLVHISSNRTKLVVSFSVS